MSLFEQDIARDMQDPEYRAGWEEAEAELFALRYAKEAVLEPTFTGWGAYVPSVPGVGVVARTRKKTKKRLLKALALHYEAMPSSWACPHFTVSFGCTTARVRIFSMTCSLCRPADRNTA